MKILAVESSCDETSVSIVEKGKFILSNVVLSQIDIHKEFGGVIPEVASRNHVKDITYVFDRALSEANLKPKDIDLVCVTEGPGLIGALLVGINAAKAFAYANDIKLVSVNHMAGHIYAAFIENEVSFPLVSLVVSGGHTMLVKMENHYEFEILGQTLDDAVGEAYDKVARVLCLPYPGGPQIDKLAVQGEDTYDLPRPYLDKEKYDFSFSGLKSAVINLNHKYKQKGLNINSQNLAASFQEAATDVLVFKARKALENYNINTLIVAGGVAANKGLRDKLKTQLKDKEILIPSIKYCTDNAAMIGVAGYYKFMKFNETSDMSLNGKSSLSLTDSR